MSFGRAADDYHRGRPSYPREAVEWVLASKPGVVADVGAGTGALSAGLRELGWQVIAVDPDPEMRATLVRTTHGVEVVGGVGERLPLPARSVDALTYGQAWHWVDPDVASREAARVLRPGGTLGLVWNIRDESTPWVRRLGEIMHRSAAEQLITGEGPRVGAPFAALSRRTWRWEREMTIDELVAMAASRSSVITAEPTARQRILDGVRALAEQQGDTGGRVILPYRTEAFRVLAPVGAQRG